MGAGDAGDERADRGGRESALVSDTARSSGYAVELADQGGFLVVLHARREARDCSGLTVLLYRLTAHRAKPSLTGFPHRS